MFVYVCVCLCVCVVTACPIMYVRRCIAYYAIGQFMADTLKQDRHQDQHVNVSDEQKLNPPTNLQLPSFIFPAFLIIRLVTEQFVHLIVAVSTDPIPPPFVLYLFVQTMT